MRHNTLHFLSIFEHEVDVFLFVLFQERQQDAMSHMMKMEEEMKIAEQTLRSRREDAEKARQTESAR